MVHVLITVSFEKINYYTENVLLFKGLMSLVLFSVLGFVLHCHNTVFHWKSRLHFWILYVLIIQNSRYTITQSGWWEAVDKMQWFPKVQGCKEEGREGQRAALGCVCGFTAHADVTSSDLTGIFRLSLLYGFGFLAGTAGAQTQHKPHSAARLLFPLFSLESPLFLHKQKEQGRASEPGLCRGWLRSNLQRGHAAVPGCH